jgi:hypothetical protein
VTLAPPPATTTTDIEDVSSKQPALLTETPRLQHARDKWKLHVTEQVFCEQSEKRDKWLAFFSVPLRGADVCVIRNRHIN